MSARADIQSAVNTMRRIKFNSYEGGKFGVSPNHHTVVITPPGGGGSTYAYHFEAVRFFRSQTPGSSKMTSTALRKVIDPDRSWLTRLFRSGHLPMGEDLLAVERGEVSVREASDRARQLAERRAAEEEKKQRRAQKAQEEAAAAAEAAAQPTTPSNTPPKPVSVPAPGRPRMALIDVVTKTQKVVLTEKQHSIRIGRTELVAFMRAHGAPNCPKTAKILLPSPDGEQRYLEDDEAVLVQWAESKSEEIEE